jgi:hypothetical protein
MKGYAIGIQNGFMSPNDVRSLENMNPIPEAEGGDTYMVNGRLVIAFILLWLLAAWILVWPRRATKA